MILAAHDKARRVSRRAAKGLDELASRLLLSLLWLFHWLSLGLLAPSASRRCAFPSSGRLNARASPATTSAGSAAASTERLKRLIRIEADVHLAERSERPVMWLAPHFMALDVAGASVLLFQKRKGISIYQRQSDPVMDRALRRGRLRLGNAGGRYFRA